VESKNDDKEDNKEDELDGSTSTLRFFLVGFSGLRGLRGHRSLRGLRSLRIRLLLLQLHAGGQRLCTSAAG